MDESEALVPEEEVSDLKVHIKGRHDVVFSPSVFICHECNWKKTVSRTGDVLTEEIIYLPCIPYVEVNLLKGVGRFQWKSFSHF